MNYVFNYNSYFYYNKWSFKTTYGNFRNAFPYYLRFDNGDTVNNQFGLLCESTKSTFF